MMMALEKSREKLNIFNLGTDEYCEVNDSIGWICAELGCAPRIEYSGGDRGWIGDNPFIFLDCSRIRALGWRPRLTIRQAVVQTIHYLQENICKISRD
jgi:UDP-glucose 4-epimerase